MRTYPRQKELDAMSREYLLKCRAADEKFQQRKPLTVLERSFGITDADLEAPNAKAKD